MSKDLLHGPPTGSGIRSFAPLTRNDYESQINLHRSQRRRMAHLPVLQAGTAGTKVQTAGLADQRYGLLVPPLPLFAEHLHHL
jgi:hypothetical protein